MKPITLIGDLHPSVNGEAILEIADVIETGRLAVEKGVGFNMAVFFSDFDILVDRTGHGCGTNACLAGTTVAVFDGVSYAAFLDRMGFKNAYFFGDTIVSTAAWHFGLDESRARKLFGKGDPEITTAQAAAVLRHLAYTGDVDWSVAR